MAYIALYWSAMVIGYYIGSKKRDHGDRFLKPTDVIMMASVSLLVFLMGIRMGSNEEVIRHLGTIGLQALYRFRWRLGRPCRYGGPGGDGKRFPFGADRPDQFHYDPRTLFRQAMNRFFALCW